MTFAQRMPNNMGTADRIIRGLLGGWMLFDGFKTQSPSGWQIAERIIGSAFVAYSVTGIDPLLAAFKVTTQPGDSNHLLNRFVRKQAPGQGIPPILTQQPVPQQRGEGGLGRRRTISEQLAIR